MIDQKLIEMKERKGSMTAMALLVMVAFSVLAMMPISMIAQLHAEKTTIGEVVAFEHDSMWWLSTTVELKTYSGSSRSVTFEGHHEFELGKTYRITTKGIWYNQMYPSLIDVKEVE